MREKETESHTEIKFRKSSQHQKQQQREDFLIIIHNETISNFVIAFCLLRIDPFFLTHYISYYLCSTESLIEGHKNKVDAIRV